MEECNHIYEVETNYILTSFPPKYFCKCKFCSKVDYIFCADLEKLIKTGQYELMPGTFSGSLII